MRLANISQPAGIGRRIGYPGLVPMALRLVGLVITGSAEPRSVSFGYDLYYPLNQRAFELCMILDDGLFA